MPDITTLVRAVVLLALSLGVGITLGCTKTETRADRDNPDATVRQEEFQRKVDCERYAKQIREEWKDEEREAYIKRKFRDEDLLPSIERLFYSLPRNSCVCIVRDRILLKGDNSHFRDHVFVFDVLTKETLWEKYYEEEGEGATLEKDIDAQFKRLTQGSFSWEQFPLVKQ
jgi:hypothetical protein